MENGLALKWHFSVLLTAQSTRKLSHALIWWWKNTGRHVRLLPESAIGRRLHAALDPAPLISVERQEKAHLGESYRQRTAHIFRILHTFHIFPFSDSARAVSRAGRGQSRRHTWSHRSKKSNNISQQRRMRQSCMFLWPRIQ